MPLIQKRILIFWLSSSVKPNQGSRLVADDNEGQVNNVDHRKKGSLFLGDLIVGPRDDQDQESHYYHQKHIQKYF